MYISDGRLKEIVAGIDIHDSPFPDDPGALSCSAEVRDMARELLARRLVGSGAAASAPEAMSLASDHRCTEQCSPCLGLHPERR